jgi:hypothetical protein
LFSRSLSIGRLRLFTSCDNPEANQESSWIAMAPIGFYMVFLDSSLFNWIQFTFEVLSVHF